MSDDKLDSVLTAWCLSAVSSVPYSSDAAVRSASGQDFRVKPRVATANVANDNQRPCHVAVLDLRRGGGGVLGAPGHSAEPIHAPLITGNWAVTLALGKQFQSLVQRLCAIAFRRFDRVTGGHHTIVLNGANDRLRVTHDACQQRFEAVERRQSN